MAFQFTHAFRFLCLAILLLAGCGGGSTRDHDSAGNHAPAPGNAANASTDSGNVATPAPVDQPANDTLPDPVIVEMPPVQAPANDALPLQEIPECVALETSLRDQLYARIDYDRGIYQDYYGDQGGGSSGSYLSGASSTMTQDVAAGDSLNVRTDGVNELDITQLAGDRLYTLKKSKLQVLDVSSEGDLQISGSVIIEGNTYGLLVRDDQVLVASSVSRETLASGPVPVDQLRHVIKLTLIDMTEPQQPVTRKEQYFEGTLASATEHGGYARLLITAGYHPLGDRLWEYIGAHGSLAAGYEALRSEIALLTLTDLLPRMFQRDTSGTFVQGAITAADCMEHVDASSDAYPPLMTLASMSLTSGASVTARHLTGYLPFAYVTADHMYLAVHGQWIVPQGGPDAGEADRLRIYMFDTPGAAPARLAASGQVQGMPPAVPQFGFDEHEGRLRVATTTGIPEWISGSSGAEAVSSRVTILAREGDALIEVGRLDDLARGDQLYAARFAGDRAYLSTFDQIDPFFTIDLSSDAPHVAGELEMPGMFTYLHALHDDVMLAIGAGNWGSNEAHITLVDVSDFAAPVERSRIVIGDDSSSDWAYTDAMWYHRVFQYSEADAVIALPLAQPGDYMLAVIGVTPEGMLEWNGSIRHSEDLGGSGGHYEHAIKHSFIRDSKVIAVSDHFVTVHALDNLDTPLSRVKR